MIWQRVQVVELTPGQDAFAVRLGRRQNPRARPGGDQHHVGVVLTDCPVGGGGFDAVVGQPQCAIAQLAAGGNHAHTHAEQLGGDVG